VEHGWPKIPLNPCTIIIASGTLLEKTTIGGDGHERAAFVDRDELSKRLRLPVEAYRSGAGTPPYTVHGMGDAGGVRKMDRDRVIEALNRTREMFGVAPPVEDAAGLRHWASAQLRSLRRLLDHAERELKAGDWPWNGAARIAAAADEYVDAIYALDSIHNGAGFDQSDFRQEEA